MKKKIKNIISLLCAAALAVSVCACKKDDNASLSYEADQKYVYGMDYIVYEGIGNGIDYVKAFELMKNLGVKSIRHWMHCDWFFDYKLNRNEANIALMHDILREAAKYDFQLVGMNHNNFNFSGKTVAKLARDVSADSEYIKWLNLYEQTWYELAKEFPEINIWEIDNETNNVDFMPNAAGGQFSLQEMTDISTDLFYYGTKGVKRANPKAQTVMGGFVTWCGEEFLRGVYENIKSGSFGEGSTDPDDYFDCLAWHPYTSMFNKQKFIEDNKAIYDIAMQYEKRAKKVYFTEVGGWDHAQNSTKCAQYVKDLYDAIKSDLPFVEAAHYYRAFDNIIDNGNNWGLFHDPNPERIDNLFGTSQRANPGSPKLSAYTYQEIAGGSGSLELLTTFLTDN